jgi:hypothetical protein
VRSLAASIADFVAKLERGLLGAEVSQRLGDILRATQYLLLTADQAIEIAAEQASLDKLEDAELKDRIAQYHAEAVELVRLADPARAEYSLADCKAQLERLQDLYHETKVAMMQAGSELRAPIPLIIEIIDQNNRIRRMGRQLVGAMRLLGEPLRASETRLEPGQPLPAGGDQT